MTSLEIHRISVERNVEIMLIFGMENVNAYQATIDLTLTQLANRSLNVDIMKSL